MKPWIFFICVLLVQHQLSAQSLHHKIVYDLVSADTADQSAVLRQFANVLKVAPDAELELVCHGPAVYMLVSEKSFFADKMQQLKQQAQVSFKAYANSMKRLGIESAQLLPTVDVVPVAILELSARQQQGWSYIRAGH